MFNSFIAKRLKGAGLPLPQVLPAIAQLLSEWQSIPPLCYAGDPPIPIELSESGIASYIAWLEQAWAIGIPKAFILSSQDYNPQLTLFINSSKFNDIESIEFSVYSEFSEKELLLDNFVNLVKEICCQFNAYQGYVYDELLARLHKRSLRIFEKQLLQTEPDMHQFVPKPLQVEGVIDILPPLLLENEFDNRRVPNGVWWVNFWDRIQIETIGTAKIRNASWAKMVELRDGAMVLAATQELTNIRNPTHLAKLSEIVEHLHLREIQNRYILPKPLF